MTIVADALIIISLQQSHLLCNLLSQFTVWIKLAKHGTKVMSQEWISDELVCLWQQITMKVS